MAMVDSHGRVFGRWNLVDAALVVLVAVLIPLVYGAYVLFRTPPPRLTAVEPGSLVAGSNLRVTVRGENLRPYMRVSFGSTQGNSFIFRNVSEALVDLNPMPPGEYDVILFDDSQERSRLTKAFTLVAPPLPASEVMLIGTFGNLTADRARGLAQGMAVENIGQIVAVAPSLPETTRVFAGPVLEIPVADAVRVPAVLRAACAVKAPQGVPQCTVGDAPLAPTSMLLLKTPIGPIPFQVDQIRGLQPVEPVQVIAQLVARTEIVDQVRVGDIDYGEYMNPLAAGAVVDRVGNRTSVAQNTDRVDLSLTTQAQRGSSSWTYAARPLRAGVALKLRTSRYDLDVVVLRVTPEWTASQPSAPSNETSGRQ